jgi:hypothetical protein
MKYHSPNRMAPTILLVTKICEIFEAMISFLYIVTLSYITVEGNELVFTAVFFLHQASY